MSDAVEIDQAGRAEKSVLANLMQFYIHDFSEILDGGTTRGELDDNGRFAEYPLDIYWQDAGHVPLLVRYHGKLAGFALVNQSSHSGLPVERNMAEFFIVRKHRRAGLGTKVAHRLFSRFAGLWEVAVMRRNVTALAFWRRAVAGHPGVDGIEEQDHATPIWDGPILRFKIFRAI